MKRAMSVEVVLAEPAGASSMYSNGPATGPSSPTS